MCFLDGSRCGQQSPSDFFDMHIIRATTPANDIHFRMSRPDINVLARQFIRIAFFEMAQLTQGAMIQRRRVGPKSTDAASPAEPNPDKSGYTVATVIPTLRITSLVTLTHLKPDPLNRHLLMALKGHNHGPLDG